MGWRLKRALCDAEGYLNHCDYNLANAEAALTGRLHEMLQMAEGYQAEARDPMFQFRAFCLERVGEARNMIDAGVKLDEIALEEAEGWAYRLSFLERFDRPAENTFLGRLALHDVFLVELQLVMHKMEWKVQGRQTLITEYFEAADGA